MKLVVDASVAVTWSLRDEAREDLDRLLRDIAVVEAYVPAIWPFEIANVLLGAVRRGRMDRDVALLELRALAGLPIRVDDTGGREAYGEVIRLAGRHALTVYDACYLELAVRRGATIATLDRQLRQAAANEGLRLIPEVQPK